MYILTTQQLETFLSYTNVICKIIENMILDMEKDYHYAPETEPISDDDVSDLQLTQAAEEVESELGASVNDDSDVELSQALDQFESSRFNKPFQHATE